MTGACSCDRALRRPPNTDRSTPFLQKTIYIISAFDDKRSRRDHTMQNRCSPNLKAKSPRDFSEDELAAYCKALGHPVRIKLLRILIKKGECISGDLADEFSLAQSTVSEHLRILKDAGLVQGTIDGPRRCYCVNGEVLNHLKSMIDGI
jgi:ArsR family transcriptional regulator